MADGYDIRLDDKYGQLALITSPPRPPHQGYTRPEGIAHKTSAPTRTVVVMVEAAGVVPTGD